MKKHEKRIVELVGKVQAYSKKMYSAAEKLREVSGDDPSLEEFCDLCEHADAEVHLWSAERKQRKQIIRAERERRKARAA